MNASSLVVISFKRRVLATIIAVLLCLHSLSNVSYAWHVEIAVNPATPGDTSSNPIVKCMGESLSVQFTANPLDDSNGSRPDQDKNILQECNVSAPTYTWSYNVTGWAGNTAWITINPLTHEGPQAYHVTCTISYTITPKDPNNASTCSNPDQAQGKVDVYTVVCTNVAGDWTVVYQPFFNFHFPAPAPYNTTSTVAQTQWSKEVETRKGNITYDGEYDNMGGPWTAQCNSPKHISDSYTAGVSGSGDIVEGITLSGSVSRTVTVDTTIPSDSLHRMRWTWQAPLAVVHDNPTSWIDTVYEEQPDGTWKQTGSTDETPQGPIQLASYYLDGADFYKEEACCSGN